MLKRRIQEANRRGPDPESPTLPDATPLAVYRWGWWWEPEDDLFGPVEFTGSLPTSGSMIAGHLFAAPESADAPAGRYLPTPTTRDHKEREPHRPNDTDTLSRALADLI